jgi:hypothetical protein
LEPLTDSAASAKERGTPSRRRILVARALAVGADGLQIFLFPLFGEGFASPADWILDGFMALALTKLVGFHWSYLPGAALELVPGADLAPSWTAAAWLATRRERESAQPARWPIAAAALLALAAAIAWFLWLRATPSS